MQNFELEKILNQKLNINSIKDYAPNGLQVEGKSEVQKIVTGVTACLNLIDYAIAQKADAILVHHGYFWKNEDPCLIGMKGKRVRKLIQHNINLFAYHIPLDIHPILGNNAQLAKLIGLKNLRPMSEKDPVPMWGEFEQPLNGDDLSALIRKHLNRDPLVCFDNAPRTIKRLGICAGGGQDYIDLAGKLNLDGFLTGEVSERTIHSARELGLNFFSAGHHATERYGIKALGEWLVENCSLNVEFKDIDNPA